MTKVGGRRILSVTENSPNRYFDCNCMLVLLVRLDVCPNCMCNLQNLFEGGGKKTEMTLKKRNN